MKDLLLALSIWGSLFQTGPVLAATAHPVIGIFSCRLRDGEKSRYPFDIWFLKKGKDWLSNDVRPVEFREAQSLVVPGALRATFDGRILGPIKLAPAEAKGGALSELSSVVEQKCDGLKKRNRQTVLLVTNLEKYSDPESWKPTPLADLNLPLPQITELLGAAPTCPSPLPAAPKQVLRLRHFDAGRAYRSADGRRALIEFKSQCPRETNEAKGMHDPNSDKFVWSYWIFRDEAGRWHKQNNLDLIDIGDFDGDGASEAVFFAGYPIPQASWGLVNLKNFRSVILSTGRDY